MTCLLKLYSNNHNSFYSDSDFLLRELKFIKSIYQYFQTACAQRLFGSENLNKKLRVTVIMLLLTFALGFSANLLNVTYGKENPSSLGTLLQPQEKIRIEVVKHIVKDSGITEDSITYWLMLANHTYGCSLIFVQVDTYYHEGYDNSKNNAGKINIWAVPSTTKTADDPNGDISEATQGGNEVKLTDGDGANIYIKDSTLSHELGHNFGLRDTTTLGDSNIMRPDNDWNATAGKVTSCHRTGTDVTDDQQKKVRESAKRFCAKEAGRGQDVYDAVGNPIGAFMDITWAEGWAEYAVTTWTLHLTLNVLSFSNVSYWLGFLIESDNDTATGEPLEGIDYIVSFNPANNLVNFSRYDVGWTPLDPTDITHEFTYHWEDLDAPPIINGISFSFPLTSLDRRAGNIVSLRAVTYNGTHTDQAPDTGFLIIGNIGSIPLAWSTDSAGNPKSTFNMSDNVYVRGQDFPVDTNVAIYLIPDGANALPANAVANASTTTNSTGGFPATLVWPQPLTLGEYDIWVDVNQNGVFDEGDVWNIESIGIYGLDVISEFLAWTPIILILIITVAIAIHKRRLLKTPIR